MPRYKATIVEKVVYEFEFDCDTDDNPELVAEDIFCNGGAIGDEQFIDRSVDVVKVPDQQENSNATTS